MFSSYLNRRGISFRDCLQISSEESPNAPGTIVLGHCRIGHQLCVNCPFGHMARNSPFGHMARLGALEGAQTSVCLSQSPSRSLETARPVGPTCLRPWRRFRDSKRERSLENVKFHAPRHVTLYHEPVSIK